jgi:mgtE-like transporter
MVNITGTFFKGISDVVGGQRAIYTVYPAMIDMIGDAGLLVGSVATVKLTLGILAPTFSSIKNHAKSIFSAWVSSLLLFVAIGLLALAITDAFTVEGIVGLLPILLVSNVIAFAATALMSYAISILTFKRGLDPDNFVIPILSALADAFTTIALFVTILIFI